MSIADFRAVFADAALQAVASPGLIRRAERDVQAGLAKPRSHSADSAEIEVDGAVVTLLPSGLRAARCTCPSREICRHILAAALLARELTADAPPADMLAADVLAEIRALTEADLVRGLGKPALRDAASLLTSAVVVVEGATCRISIAGQPEVSYVAGGGIAGMLSKAPAARAKALHAAALLAVRGDPVSAPETVVQPPDPGFLAEVRAGLLAAAQSGLRSAPRALQDRLLDLAVSSRADGLPALSGLLRQVAGRIAERRNRDPAFDPVATLSLIARAFAVTEAAGAVPPGTPRQAYNEAFETLSLIGCGVDVWCSGSGARGATAYLYAPALDRWFSVSLARAGGQDPSFVPEDAARSGGAVWGHSLVSVGHSRVRLTAAKASAEGRLSLGQETCATLQSMVLTKDDIAAWRSVFRDWDDVLAALSARFQPSLHASDAQALPVLLAPVAIGRVMFDDTAQQLVLPVQDRRGRWIGLTVDHDDARPLRERAIEAFIPAGEVLLVALASHAGPRFELRPVAAMRSDATDSFALGDAGKAPASGAAKVTWAAASGATDRLLARVRDEMVGFCELGGRMQDAQRADRLGALARRAADLGLEPLAKGLGRVETGAGGQRVAAILMVTHIADVLAALRRRLPWLAI